MIMRFKPPRSSLFSVSFKPGVYLPSWPMQCMLADPTHVLRPAINDRLQSRPKKGLWLRFAADGIGAKATVRRWAKRRVKQAMREELSIRGLDMNWTGVKGQEKNVRGTMELIIKQPTVGAEWKDVKMEVARLVDAVVEKSACKIEEKPRKKTMDG